MPWTWSGGRRRRPHSAVLPHEGIHPERVDALAPDAAAGLQPAPILLVHRGPGGAPLVHTRPSNLHRPLLHRPVPPHHRIWALRDPARRSESTADALAHTTPMIADGHHRYAAYLRLQTQHPGTGWDRGLAMLVDQDDTPLFLGHPPGPARPHPGRGRSRCRARGWRCAPSRRAAAVNALAPTTVVLTDGSAWAALPLPVGRVAPSSTSCTTSSRRGPGHRGSPTTTTWTSRSARSDAGRGGRPDAGARLQPGPHLVAHERLLPEKATSFQPKPTVGLLMRAMHDGRVAPVTSTSTRDAGPGLPPEEPAPHRAHDLDHVTGPPARTVRRALPPHTAHSRASTLARPDAAAGGRSTTTRRLHRGSPLGRMRSTGSWDGRPTRRTSFLTSVRVGTVVVIWSPPPTPPWLLVGVDGRRRGSAVERMAARAGAVDVSDAFPPR